MRLACLSIRQITLRAYAEALCAAVARPEYIIPSDLRRHRNMEEARALAQQLVGQFGQLLDAWPEMFDAARRLRERGVRVGQMLS